MITVEVRINGSIISVMSAVNRGYTGSGTDECQYEYQTVRFPEDSKGAPRVHTGFIKHKRKDGAEELVTRIIKAAAK